MLPARFAFMLPAPDEFMFDEFMFDEFMFDVVDEFMFDVVDVFVFIVEDAFVFIVMLRLLTLLVLVASPPQAIMLPATRVSASAVRVFFIVSS